MEYEYVPFGNAFYAIQQCKQFQYPDTRFCWANATYANRPGVFDGELICQHGPGECAANLLEMCVIQYEPDWTKYAPFLMCYESMVSGHGIPASAAPDCAKKTGIDITKALACTQNKAESTALVQATARKTCALQPEHQFTPWIVINGKACGLDGRGCPGLLSKVCGLWSGAKPAGCAGL
jgi:interferon gamma-inducible protein 30